MNSPQIIQTPNKIDVQIVGRSMKDLFEKCGATLFTVLDGGDETKHQRLQTDNDRREQSVQVTAVDQMTLLVDWLTELLSLADLESVYFDQIIIDSINDTSLRARVSGHPMTYFSQPVSSVDYDSVKIYQTSAGLVAHYSLDL